ncbi:hypothetical protein QU593_10430 [Rossellomorea marisflavi]|nr:hypothetical protein [Rossellomorea marisflavi]WJV20822.1 hypothetical protein QU593_10430 [Rossellomorea marisflavi]
MEITFNNGSKLKTEKSSTVTRGVRANFIEWAKPLNSSEKDNSK